MGQLPTNLVVGRVMVSLRPQNAPQGTFEHKPCSCGCYTAPRWWNISRPWRGSFRARSQRATGGDALLLSVGPPSKQEWVGVSLSGGALLCVDSLWWGTTWLGRYVQLSGHDLLFPERISPNPLPYCFHSGLSPHTFQASWESPVFNIPEFVVTLNCGITRNFHWFQESENLRI